MGPRRMGRALPALAGLLILLAAPAPAHAAGPPVVDGSFKDWDGLPTFALGGAGGPETLALSLYNDFQGRSLFLMVRAPEAAPLQLTVKVDVDFNGTYADPDDRVGLFTCQPGQGAASAAGYAVYTVSALASGGAPLLESKGLPDSAPSASGTSCEYRIPYAALGLLSGEEARIAVTSAAFTRGEWVTAIGTEVAWQRVPTLGAPLTALLAAGAAAAAAARIQREGRGR